MNLQVHFAQKIIKKYLKLATMAQNEIWTCWEENLEKIKIFEKSISSQIVTVNMTKFHIETITQIVKNSTQFFITMKLKIHMQRIKSFLPPPSLVFYPLLFLQAQYHIHAHRHVNKIINSVFKNFDFFEIFLSTCPNFILSLCSAF